MPLAKGTSKKTLHKNIEEMVKAGYPPKQAAAAAYSQQREARKNHDGGCPIRALQAFLKDCANG
ncbi:hypothetical protein JXVLWARM_CDS_0011 [Burkholderia phage Bm1]